MLTVEDLSISFTTKQGVLNAVKDVSFTIPEKQIVGLVGESGSGKTISAMSVLNLLPPTAQINATRLEWNQQNLLGLSEKEFRSIRGNEIGFVFQNPLAALNPVFTIGNQLIESLQRVYNESKSLLRKRALHLLEQVKIPNPEQRLDQYPHEFSLGMCQRVMIAMALSQNPKLIIADEPTASLDVTIQAQLLYLLKALRQDFNLSMLLISHDLGVIAQSCDYLYIMYLGQIVEEGPTSLIFSNPKHPYTKALISAIPLPDPSQPMILDMGETDIPGIYNIPSGCRFHPRCLACMELCKDTEPALLPLKDEDRKVACHLMDLENPDVV